MFYHSPHNSYTFVLSNLSQSEQKSSVKAKINLTQLEYIEYTNNHNNIGVTLCLCFYLDYLIGIKFVKFQHKIVKPTHILKDTWIWDNIKPCININSKIDNILYKNWLNFLDEYFSANLSINNFKNKNIIQLKLACTYATPFQFSVWLELLKVSNTSTYSKIAENINRNKAVRAVGTAVSQNPIGIFIPCHRILPKQIFESNINSNSFIQVGQYMNGADIKKFLLNLELKLSS